jgi:hypothetical protein
MQQQDNTPQGGGLSEKTLADANAENEDAMAARDEPSSDAEDDTEFSNEHPLASPGELAGTADQAIAREIEALGPADGSLAASIDEEEAEEAEEAERRD